LPCNCCLTSDARVTVGGTDISNQVHSVSVDSSQEVNWEDNTDATCNPMGDKLYLFGPGKTTIQISAYPFKGEDDYTMGFECPVNVSMNSNYKWIYDCRFCDECLGSDGTKMKRKGKWRAIELKKKQVSVVGDIEGVSSLFEVSGCKLNMPKFSIQAGPQPVTLPQYASQYSRLRYLGHPFPFDTDDFSTEIPISVIMGTKCPGFQDIKAKLTNFQFTFTPPQPPTVTYSFESMVSICPTCN
jgi:hypothetical protein